MKGIQMLIFPAIDLCGGKVVRLRRGDYDRMTVYSADPTEVAASFAAAGATELHVVDLDAARDGGTPNAPAIIPLIERSGLRVEVGGGIRTRDAAERYISAGAARVILGTAAVTDPDFLGEMVGAFGEKAAVGVDLRDGRVAIRGWKELSEYTADAFFAHLTQIGVRTVICTDISRDGLLSGTNRGLYASLGEKYPVNLIASGGVTDIDDVRALREMKMYGAIIGRAIYEKTISLADAVREAKG